MSQIRRVDAMKRAGLVLKSSHPRAREVAEATIVLMRSRGFSVMLEEEAAAFLGRPAEGRPREEVCRSTDLVLSLGGDGTMLGTARAAKQSGVPLLGVNLGELGYLTMTTPETLPAFLDLLQSGRAVVEERMMLHGTLLRGGSLVGSWDVLNDVVLTKSALARILDLDVRIDGKFVSIYRADGLILSTPTGSTAYALAAQGPILQPDLDAIVLAPICPHTLTLRPVVVPGNSEFEIRALTERTDAFLSLDGQIGVPIQTGDLIHVRRSPFVTRLLADPTRDHFATLREKLRWGGALTRR